MTVSVLSAAQQAALAEMQIDRWVLRSAVDDSNSIEPANSAAVSEQWLHLNARILSCTQCGLHKSRTQAVCGVGNFNADCLVIGEAPGAEEDRQGEPFVGRAGKLLDEMLRAIGLNRETVYIANILKCRPPQNRDPSPAESQACMPYLKEQIALLMPRLILVVGRIAAQNLLESKAAIGRMRGQVYSYGDQQIPVVVTYHPAYLLRSPEQKAKSWQDLLLARDLLQGVDA